MSQASKVLKEIATGPEYQALVQAVEKGDYDAVAQTYGQLNGIIEAKKKEILEKIDSLTRQNKNEDSQQFLKSFAVRISTTLPQWHRLNTLMQEQKVTEGEVIGVGSKGDPMVRSTDGKLNIISGLTAEKGTKVIFKITKEGDKVNFGQKVEFNADFFYSLLNQTALNGIRDRFNAIEGRVRTAADMNPALLSELLGELEKVKELAAGLRQDEKERVESRIMTLRKRLFNEYGVKMAMAFIEKQETDDITAICNADAEKITCAMAAPGLFRYEPYRAIKAELFAGKSLKGYDEAVKKLESDLDSMDAAMKLMEFQSAFEQIEPSARVYLEKIDQLFDRINRRVRTVIASLAETKDAPTDIQSQVEAAFNGKIICTEISGVFRSPTEYFTLREALTKLRTSLGNSEGLNSEAAIRPYIEEKIHLAFGR